MKKSVRILLIVIALVCFGIALYYPISEYVMQKQSVNTMDRLAALRDEGLEEAEALATDPPETEAPVTEAPVTEAPIADEGTAEPAKQGESEQQATEERTEQPVLTAAVEKTDAPSVQANAQTVQTTNAPTTAPAATEPQKSSATAEPMTAATGTIVTMEQTAAPAVAGNQVMNAATEAPAAATDAPTTEPVGEETPVNAAETTQAPGAEETPSPAPTATPTPSPTPSPTPDRRVTTGAKIWSELEKVPLEEAKILPQYRKLYSINNEMVGWMTISDTKIDYPVMQTDDEEYYLSHDFFHDNNANGLLILDRHCDPYTPSYNLVVSGHNRKNDTIFSNLYEYYRDKRHRDAHMFIKFDSLMEERTYVVFAAFFAADYDVDEEGFRYNANIEYAVDAKQWLREINEYKLYETNVDVGFGDQFLTLTTCNSSRRKNGRFVVVARRVREGETFD